MNDRSTPFRVPLLIGLGLSLGHAACKQSINGTSGGTAPKAPTAFSQNPAVAPSYTPPVAVVASPSTTQAPVVQGPKLLFFPLKSERGYCAGAGEGVGAFGAPRSGGGRVHAACDVYNSQGTIVYAIADGEVIDDGYPFYCETDALEVNHGDFVVRYGEIKPGSAKFRKGQKVKAGQAIAQVGLLSCYDQPMLHFEKYTGKASGPLSTPGNKYSRRSDLVDPTSFLKGLHGKKPP